MRVFDGVDVDSTGGGVLEPMDVTVDPIEDSVLTVSGVSVGLTDVGVIEGVSASEDLTGDRVVYMRDAVTSNHWPVAGKTANRTRSTVTDTVLLTK
jgi:hypothetical protein